MFSWLALGTIPFNILISDIGDIRVRSTCVFVRCTDNIKWGSITLTKDWIIRQGEPDDFVDVSDETRQNLIAQIEKPGI